MRGRYTFVFRAWMRVICIYTIWQMNDGNHRRPIEREGEIEDEDHRIESFVYWRVIVFEPLRRTRQWRERYVCMYMYLYFDVKKQDDLLHCTWPRCCRMDSIVHRGRRLLSVGRDRDWKQAEDIEMKGKKMNHWTRVDLSSFTFPVAENFFQHWLSNYWSNARERASIALPADENLWLYK